MCQAAKRRELIQKESGGDEDQTLSKEIYIVTMRCTSQKDIAPADSKFKIEHPGLRPGYTLSATISRRSGPRVPGPARGWRC